LKRKYYGFEIVKNYFTFANNRLNESSKALISACLDRTCMGRSYDDWIKTQDQALLAKVRAGDEANKPLLNQINWIWVANLMNKKAELNPTSGELLDWITSGQVDAFRKPSK